MEGVVALFDSMRDTEAPARWVYQQNKTTFEIVPCTFSFSRPILPGTKRGPCGAEIACTNRVSHLVILGFYEVAYLPICPLCQSFSTIASKRSVKI